MEAFALSPDAPRVPLPQRLLSDERLLRLIAAGNSQAFGAVYARYHAPLYAYCRSIVRDPDDARDALQNTMMKALAALGRGQDRELALKPWLFRIAHNESISLLRRRRPSEPLTDAVSPPVASADRVAVARERLSQLVADLQALPERQRGALIMREVNGLSYDEIAAALGISSGAARQTVFEARTALTEYGEGREVACENIRRSISDGDGRALRARRVRAHLRACNECRDFQTTLTVRRRELALLAPGLSGASAVAVLQGLLTAGVVGSAGTAAVGGAGLLGGSASTLLATGAAKSVVALVAVTAAGAGAVEIEHQVARHKSPPAAHASAAASAPAGPAARTASAMIQQADARPQHALTRLDEPAGDEGGRGHGRHTGSGGADGAGQGNGSGNGPENVALAPLAGADEDDGHGDDELAVVDDTLDRPARGDVRPARRPARNDAGRPARDEDVDSYDEGDEYYDDEEAYYDDEYDDSYDDEDYGDDDSYADEEPVEDEDTYADEEPVEQPKPQQRPWRPAREQPAPKAPPAPTS